MDIKEIRKRKSSAEHSIQQIINDFVEETKTQVVGVDIRSRTIMNSDDTILYKDFHAELDIKIV